MKSILSPKKILMAVVITGILVGLAAHFNLLPASIGREAVVPQQVTLATEAPTYSATTSTVAEVPLPTSKPGKVNGPCIRINIWAWNAQMGLMFANGGPKTTSGSLMEKNSVCVQLTRQDDTNKSQQDQILFASELSKGNSNPANGPHYVIIMGDQAAGYLQKCNTATKALGDEFRCEIVGAAGYSRGEDVWLGPQEWKDDPQATKGKGTAGVLREGDWNITLYALGQNGIKNNPDPTTWDLDAHNWFAADDYLKAAQMYISGYCEERPVVSNGRKTGQTHHACVEAVTTWTPGDVNIAKGKGGLVRLLSTEENPYQMPAVIIGIRKWNNENPKKVASLLKAITEGGDQVRHHEAALSKAAQISAAVYGEQTAAYWSRYFKGVTERDKTGIPVKLGGSTTMNLGDNLVLFGLTEDSGGLENSVFNAAYSGFGNIIVQQYPDLMSTFPSITQAVNTRFLNDLKSQTNNAEAGAEVVEFSEPISPTTPKEAIVASRNWSINFDTGSATLSASSVRTLTELYNQLVIGGGLTVEIQGHTDNVGNPVSNKILSDRRAESVKRYLQETAPRFFPDNRVTTQGYGDSKPVASNLTPEGRASNRRVTIILGQRQ